MLSLSADSISSVSHASLISKQCAWSRALCHHAVLVLYTLSASLIVLHTYVGMAVCFYSYNPRSALRGFDYITHHERFGYSGTSWLFRLAETYTNYIPYLLCSSLLISLSISYCSATLFLSVSNVNFALLNNLNDSVSPSNATNQRTS